MCLPWSLRAGTGRGVYAASARHSPCDIADFPERREREDGEAASRPRSCPAWSGRLTRALNTYPALREQAAGMTIIAPS